MAVFNRKLPPQALQAILDNLQDSIVAFNCHGMILGVNSAAEQLFDLTTEQMLHKTLPDLMPDKAAQQLIDVINKYVSCDTSSTLLGHIQTEWHSVTTDSPCHLWWDLSVLDMNDEPIFIGIARDISEQTQAETDLLLRDQQLSALVELQKNLLDPNLDWNDLDALHQSILELLGESFELQQALFFQVSKNAQNHTEVRLSSSWQADDIPTLSADLQQTALNFEQLDPHWLNALNSSDGPVMAFTEGLPDIEKDICTRLGIASFLAFPLLVKNDLQGIIVFNDYNTPRVWENMALDSIWTAINSLSLFHQRLQDDATIRQKNVELSQTLSTLKGTQIELLAAEKMAALGQLIANISHELNTPLAAIRSASSTLDSFVEGYVPQLPNYFREIPNTLLPTFLKILSLVMAEKPVKSVKEERKIRRKLIIKLDALNIPDADIYADHLVEMGIHEYLDIYLPLLQNEHGIHTLQVAYRLSDLQRGLKTIRSAMEQANAVVTALRSFSQHENTDQYVLSNIQTGLDNVLKTCVQDIQRGITVHTDYADLPQLMGYPEKLQQIWLNLIQNALYAMNYSGDLYIRGRTSNNNIVVEIEDSGCGISEEHQDKVFQAFFTTRPTGEGAGLGLEIVRHIVEQHHGKITFCSQKGKTIFTVQLPIR